MRRRITRATLAIATLSLTFLPGVEAPRAQQAKSCPALEQCRSDCGKAHTACRANISNPIFVCQQNKDQCLTRCNLTVGKNCGPRPTERPK